MTVHEDDDKARALEANRAARALVTASVEQQQGKMSIDAVLRLVRNETERIDPVALVGSIAGLAAAHVMLLAHGTGKTPHEIINLGAMGVEQGYEGR